MTLKSQPFTRPMYANFFAKLSVLLGKVYYSSPKRIFLTATAADLFITFLHSYLPTPEGWLQKTELSAHNPYWAVVCAVPFFSIYL